MKRDEGTARPKASTLASVSLAGSRWIKIAAHSEVDHPGAGRHDRERRLVADQMRQQRGVGIVDAAIDRHGRARSDRLSDLGKDRRQHIEGRADTAPLGRAMSSVSISEEYVASPWIPQIGMAAERRDLVGGNAGQPPRPVLRIGDDGRDAGEIARERLSSGSEAAHRD